MDFCELVENILKGYKKYSVLHFFKTQLLSSPQTRLVISNILNTFVVSCVFPDK